MVPATRNLLAAGAVVAAGAVGWAVLGPEKKPDQSDDGAAIVQQPSGEVLTAGTQAQDPADKPDATPVEDQSAGPAEDGSKTEDTANAAEPGNRIGAFNKDAITDQEDDQSQGNAGAAAQSGSEAENEALAKTDDDPQAQEEGQGEAGSRGTGLSLAALGTQAEDGSESQSDAATAQGDQNEAKADQDDSGEGQADVGGRGTGLQLAALPLSTDESATDADPKQNDKDNEAATEEQDPKAPRFDVVRVDQDGQAVLAGSAEPGSVVEIVLAGVVIATATADASGQFVAVVDVALGDQAQSLQLRVLDDSENAQQQTVAALDQEPAVVRPTPGLSEPIFPNGKPKAPASDTLPAAGDAPQQSLSSDGAQDQGATGLALIENPASLKQSQSAEGVDAPKQPDNGSVSEGVIAVITTDDRPKSQSSTADQTQVASVEPEAAPSAPAAVEGGRYRTSAPVIILPSRGGTDVPALVQPNEAGIALLQPSNKSIRGVVLDQISYSDDGEVRLSGRARAGKAVRVYGNGLVIGTTAVAQDGTWSMQLPAELGRTLKLFRFDELEKDGAVASRIETPFEYARLSPKVVRERRVVVQRGDMLWRIAEQFYGEGLRYSVIYGANTEQIRDPDLIYPGQVFAIPELVDAN